MRINKLFRNYILEALLWVCIIFISFYFYTSVSFGRYTPQSLLNLNLFDPKISLMAYPKVCPPFYPFLVSLLTKIGLLPFMANFIFFVFTLVLISFLSRLSLGGASWCWPVILYGISTYNFVNSRQYTSEALFIPLSLFSLVLLWNYVKKPTLFNLIFISLGCCFLYLTRYFGLFCFLPLTLFNIILINIKDQKRLIFHSATCLLLSLAPVCVWMGKAYLETGYLTGIDRFSDRVFTKKLALWGHLTTFSCNLFFSIKTIFIDFFSFSTYANHKSVLMFYAVSPLEFVALGLFLYLMLMQLMNLYSLIRRGCFSNKGSFVSLLARATTTNIGILSIEYSFVYLAATIIVWSIGNNDPLYTRFLYPVYPFLILSIFFYYFYILGNKCNLVIQRFIFICLYVYCFLVNIYRNFFLT